jgi:hypothetical protein
MNFGELKGGAPPPGGAVRRRGTSGQPYTKCSMPIAPSRTLTTGASVDHAPTFAVTTLTAATHHARARRNDRRRDLAAELLDKVGFDVLLRASTTMPSCSNWRTKSDRNAFPRSHRL